MSPLRKQFVISKMDFQNAGYVSSYIKKDLMKLKINKEIIRKVVIASYEAEINVVIHSFGGMCEYEIDKTKIKIAFKDTGPGIEDIEQAMQSGFSTANKSALEHGFGAGQGLLNIKNSSDEFQISSSTAGTKLLIIVNF